MAVTQNTYTGNGSTVLYSFTFPYLETTDIKVSVNGTITTAYTLANATTIQFNTAPANGAAIRIYRETDDSGIQSTFFAGSAIRSQDLNNNFTQTLYLSQESVNEADSATATANTALTNSNTAISTANTAVSTANSAVSSANTAVSTANTASTNATAAVNTANTASSNASAAVSTANAASASAASAVTTANGAVTTANGAVTTANTATSTANSALSAANSAVSTANTASSNASAAVSTANTASTNASAAVSTANTASSNATTAVSTANSAVTTANAAAAAVANAVLYTTVANVAAIPGTPANNTAVEITDSTGIESFTPLSGLPGGFVGSSGLSARIIYQTVGSTWTWIQYFSNDPESRYLKLSGGTLTGQLRGDDSTSASTPGFAFDGDPNTGVGRPGADELALITGGTARLTIDPAGAVAVAGSLSQGGNAVVVTTDSRLSDTRIPTDGTVTNAKVAVGAAIDKTKISGTAITAADTGTVTSAMIADGQVTSAKIADATIVNQDVSLTAAIDGTKISPNFGSQNVVTTGTVSGASLIPTSSSVPTNGVYLPSANNVAISTNGTGRLFVDSSGRVGVGTSSPAQALDVNGSITTRANGYLRSIGTGSDTEGAGPNVGVGATNSAAFWLQQLNASRGLDFWNYSDGVTGWTRRLTIDSSGKVGIGSSTPNGALEIASSSANQLIINDPTGAFNGQKTVDINALRAGVGYHNLRINGFDIRLSTGGSETERARIDSSGRLLVGTSTGSSNGSLFALMPDNSNGTGIVVRARNSGATASQPAVVFEKPDTTVNSAIISDIGTNYLAFNHNGAERMRILSNGYIQCSETGTYGIDAGSAWHKFYQSSNQRCLQTYNTSGTFNNHSLTQYVTVAGSTGAGFASGYSDGGSIQRYLIFTNGNIQNTNNSYGALSDIKLKENVVDARSQWDDIKAVKVRNYNLKIEPEHRQIGVVAQEIEQVSPGLVYESPDRDAEGNDLGTVTKSVNYSVLYMKAVKALQEAMERIEQLEAEMATVKAQLS